MQICEFYVFPQEPSYVVFSPHCNTLTKITAGFLAIINKLRSHSNLTEETLTSEFGLTLDEVDLLIESGILVETDLNEIIPETSQMQNLTLFPTTKCNLACVYCYARGGEKEINMPLSMAKDAVNYIIDQLPDNQKKFTIHFHGGGEPTQNFGFIKEITEYSENLCRQRSKTLRINLVSNGTLSNDKINWIIKHVKKLLISFDGFPDIQNRQRPFKNGAKSSMIVENTIRKLSSKMSIAVRATITASTVSQMEDIYRYFCSLGVTSIHMEPISAISGRAQDNDLEVVDLDEYLVHLLNCLELSRETSIPMALPTGDCLSKLDTFCGATRPQFCLTPEGIVTTCYEVVDESIRGSELFIIGKYQPNEHTFLIDEEKVKNLQTRRVRNLTQCQSCFAKYWCAGGCPIRAYFASGDILGYDLNMCKFRRKLHKIILYKLSQGFSFGIKENEIIPLPIFQQD